MKTVKLITCDDAFQAHVIQGALKNEGIASVLYGETKCFFKMRKYSANLLKFK